MSRAVVPSGRKLLLLALAVVVIGGAWWYRSPREPVVGDRHFSELFAVYEKITSHYKEENEWRDFRQQRDAFEPAVVPWLTYELEYGGRPFVRQGPLPLDSAPAWLRRRAPGRWGGLQPSPKYDERRMAAWFLADLGPRAAPAIPALTRSLANEDRRLVMAAATALQEIGPDSWPAVLDSLQHGTQEARVQLLEAMRVRIGSDTADASASEMARAVPVLVKAMGDAAPEVRAAAANAVCVLRYESVIITRYGVFYHSELLPLLQPLIGLLSDEVPAVVTAAMGALPRFGAEAAPALPRLRQLAVDGDSNLQEEHASWLVNAIVKAMQSSQPISDR